MFDLIPLLLLLLSFILSNFVNLDPILHSVKKIQCVNVTFIMLVGIWKKKKKKTENEFSN